ncbi:MAG: Bacterial polymerase, alpha chain terminal domain [Candidatus Saccharibacteria bacterium]|nr:Bacterial polymerase, alpha chain terminal domain [Candidatus Saccharibacteria bacterium]
MSSQSIDVTKMLQDLEEKAYARGVEDGRKQAFAEVNAALQSVTNPTPQPPVRPRPVTSDTPVQNLDFGTRVFGRLRLEGIVTVGDLIQRSEKDLLYLPQFGPDSLKRVVDLLATHNLSLSKDDYEHLPMLSGGGGGEETEQ